ncbi:MAG: HAD family hydrolase [Vulcanimicrobiaceae bacterium]
MRASAVGIGFDFDHTLGIDNKLERVAFLRMLELIEADGGAALGTLNDEIARVDALLARQRAGGCTIEAAVEQFARERGASQTQRYVDYYKGIVLEAVTDFVVALPGARTLPARLRDREIRYAILTNGWAPLQQRKGECVGFDGPVLVSGEIGTQKPDPGAFAFLADVLALPPERVWYVGDNPETDVAGAIGAGMRGVWLDAEGLTYPPNGPAPSAVIHSLHEVLALVRP